MIISRKTLVYLLCILGLAAGLRALALGRPYLGNFSSYQVDCASISRFFLRERFSHPLSPKLDVLVDRQPGILCHYYPVASLVAVVGAALAGGSMEIWGRVQAILFSLGTIFLIFLIAKRIRGPDFGLIAAAVYALSPVSVIYGQSFMNEAAGVFFVVLSVYSFIKIKEGGSKAWMLCGIFSAGVALVTRVNGFYLFVPLLVLWGHGPARIEIRGIKWWFVVCISAGILPLLWYGYTYVMAQTNSHVYNCMFAQLGRQAPSNMLNVQFWKTLLHTIATLDFTPVGLVLLIVGLGVGLGGRENRWLYVWLLAVLGSFLLMPQKIIDHNFYTLHLIPPASFFIARGVQWGWERILLPLSSGARRFALVAALLVIFGSSVRYFYHPVVKTVLKENEGVLRAAQGVQRLVPKDEKIIAARGSSDGLLCYSDRRGWPFMVTPMKKVPYQDLFRWRFKSGQEIERLSTAYCDPIQWLEYLRGEGASYFVVAGPEELEQNKSFQAYLTAKYPKISSESEPYQIYDLEWGHTP